MWKKLLRNNIGVTLVELIVTIAIMTIVGGAITSFIVVSQRNYNNGVAETELQYEAQMVVNQLQDLMIDTARGISYQYKQDAMSDPEYVFDDSEIDNPDVQTTKTLYIYDAEVYYLLKWDEATKEVRFFEYNKDGSLVPGVSAEGELLAEFVTGFSVDLRELSSKRTVSYVLTLTKDGTGKSYTTSHKIKLRNEVLVNADLSEIYTPEETEVVPNTIIVEPQFVYMWPGDSAQLYARVTSLEGGIPSQSVNWEINEHKDNYGNDITDTVIDPATAKLNLSLNGKYDADHLFYVNAKKILGDGTELVGTPGTTVFIRNITGILASDTRGNTSSNEAKNNVITEGVVITAGVGFLGKYIDGLSNYECGGAYINVTEGADYLEVVKKEEESGTITFNVKPGLDFSNNKTYTATIHFSARKDGFTEYACDIKYTIKKKGDFNIDVSDDSWKRMGTINMVLSDIDPNLVEERDDGLYFRDSVGNRNIDIKLVFYDSLSNRTCRTITLSNNSNGILNGIPVQSQDGVCTVQIPDGNLKNLKVTLNPVTSCGEETVAYAFPYYTTMNYDQNWSPCADYVDITVIISGTQTQTITLPIDPVSFGYRRFFDAEANDSWSIAKEEDNASKVIYVTTSSEDSRIYKVYYQMQSGWVADNNNYTLDNTRFVGIVGDVADGNKYTFAGISCEKESDGTPFIKFTLNDPNDADNLMKAGTVITTVYEYNALFGNEEQAKWYSDYYRKLFEQVTGCKGNIKFVFVEPNIVAENVDVKPTRSYCPAPEELGDLQYYYISETERFKIEQDSYGSIILGYEQKSGSTWSSPWGNRGLQWNDAQKKWILNNVVINDNRTGRPSVLYCPSPNQADIADSGYVYDAEKQVYNYVISVADENGKSDEKYVMSGSVSSGYEISYVKDGKAIWGNATLYWNTGKKIWTTRENNVEPDKSWSSVEPSILYCPAPKKLNALIKASELAVKDGLAYYGISMTEYYAYNASNETITYVTTSDNLKSQEKVWGDKVLYWSESTSKWTSSPSNIVIHDDRTKPSSLYCPGPVEYGWTFDYRYYNYYYYINGNECFELDYWYYYNYGVWTIRYYKANGIYWEDQWNGAVLYWDADRKIWTHNIVIPADKRSNNYVMPSIDYCPSPSELLSLYNSGGLEIVYGDKTEYYYNISETERLRVWWKNNSFSEIKYQQKIDGIWKSKWNNNLKWDSNREIWYRNWN